MLGSRRGGVRLRPGPRVDFGFASGGSGVASGGANVVTGGRDVVSVGDTGVDAAWTDDSAKPTVISEPAGEPAVIGEQLDGQRRHADAEAGRASLRPGLRGLRQDGERAPVRERNLGAGLAGHGHPECLQPDHARPGEVGLRIGARGGRVDLDGDGVGGDLAAEEAQAADLGARLAGRAAARRAPWRPS